MSKFQVEFIISIENKDPNNSNADVNIVFEDGSRYFGTFFTLKNISELMSNHRKSGESAYGIYFWATNMCIVSKLTSNIIEDTIEDLIQNGLFEEVFFKIEDE